MAQRGGIDTAIGHWAQLMEGMQASSLDFYDAIEAAIKRREIPDCKLRRVLWPEGGFLSARREYLRAKRAGYHIDICGAPFGTAFFSSSWLCIPPPTIWVAVVLFLIGLFYGLQNLERFVFFARGNGFLNLFAFDALRPTAIELAAILGLDFVFLVCVAIFGIIRPLFFPPRLTFYRIDTADMFYRAVQAAVREVVDGLRSAQGLRALTDEEWKPVMREFSR